MAVVEAAFARGQPQLLQRRLRVDDDVAAIGEGQFQKPAGAARVDVHHIVFQPAIEQLLHGRQHREGLGMVVGVAEGLVWCGQVRGRHGR